MRDVQLRGEAFFAVTKNPAQPFMVHTAKVAVKVLGTSFLVKAYPQLPATTVLVHTGPDCSTVTLLILPVNSWVRTTPACSVSTVSWVSRTNQLALPMSLLLRPIADIKVEPCLLSWHVISPVSMETKLAVSVTCSPFPLVAALPGLRVKPEARAELR